MNLENTIKNTSSKIKKGLAIGAIALSSLVPAYAQDTNVSDVVSQKYDIDFDGSYDVEVFTNQKSLDYLNGLAQAGVRPETAAHLFGIYDAISMNYDRQGSDYIPQKFNDQKVQNLVDIYFDSLGHTRDIINDFEMEFFQNTNPYLK